MTLLSSSMNKQFINIITTLQCFFNIAICSFIRWLYLPPPTKCTKLDSYQTRVNSFKMTSFKKKMLHFLKSLHNKSKYINIHKIFISGQYFIFSQKLLTFFKVTSYWCLYILRYPRTKSKRQGYWTFYTLTCPFNGKLTLYSAHQKW